MALPRYKGIQGARTSAHKEGRARVQSAAADPACSFPLRCRWAVVCFTSTAHIHHRVAPVHLATVHPCRQNRSGHISGTLSLGTQRATRAEASKHHCCTLQQPRVYTCLTRNLASSCAKLLQPCRPRPLQHHNHSQRPQDRSILPDSVTARLWPGAWAFLYLAVQALGTWFCCSQHHTEPRGYLPAVAAVPVQGSPAAAQRCTSINSPMLRSTTCSSMLLQMASQLPGRSLHMPGPILSHHRQQHQQELDSSCRVPLSCACSHRDKRRLRAGSAHHHTTRLNRVQPVSSLSQGLLAGDTPCTQHELACRTPSHIQLRDLYRGLDSIRPFRPLTHAGPHTCRRWHWPFTANVIDSLRQVRGSACCARALA